MDKNLALETLLASAYGGTGSGSGGGGGTGTSNYNDLTNRPKINGITLSGNKSTSDLGIAEYDDTALSGRVTTVEGLLDSHTVRKDVPADAVFTDTTYDDTEIKSGLQAAQSSITTLQTAIDNLPSGSSVEVDSVLSDTSENPVQNKVIKAALDGLSTSGVVVDTTLSDTSENPVQNKVIKAALDGKADSSDIPDITGKANTSDLADVATSGDYDDLTNKPEIPDVSGKANTADLAAVATSGAYSDLTGTPTIPEAAEIATAAKAGLVKPGSGLNITSDGTLVVTTPVDGNTKTAATYTVEYDASTHSLIRRKLADDGNGYDADFTPQTIELPDWSGEIATATQELSDTGWINLDVNSNYTSKGGTMGAVKYRKKNGYVTITFFDLDFASPSSTTNIAVMPSGCIPAERVVSTLTQKDPSLCTRVALNTDGTVNLEKCTQGVLGEITYPV